jgi:Kef-type K+ transport system membrane component KefB
VIFLLFEVGLESNIKQMMEVGLSSFLVALVGVVVPMVLGWGVAALVPASVQHAHPCVHRSHALRHQRRHYRHAS